jgi:hypothetical protein
MSATDIQILLASVGVLLVTVGAGTKWLLMYIGAKQAEAALAESTARNELSARLHEEIRVLRVELAGLHTENRVYLRRIFQLEGFIHNYPDITLPDMEGWPPK